MGCNIQDFYLSVFSFIFSDCHSFFYLCCTNSRVQYFTNSLNPHVLRCLYFFLSFVLSFFLLSFLSFVLSFCSLSPSLISASSPAVFHSGELNFSRSSGQNRVLLFQFTHPSCDLTSNWQVHFSELSANLLQLSGSFQFSATNHSIYVIGRIHLTLFFRGLKNKT